MASPWTGNGLPRNDPRVRQPALYYGIRHVGQGWTLQHVLDRGMSGLDRRVCLAWQYGTDTYRGRLYGVALETRVPIDGSGLLTIRCNDCLFVLVRFIAHHVGQRSGRLIADYMRPYILYDDPDVSGLAESMVDHVYHMNHLHSFSTDSVTVSHRGAYSSQGYELERLYRLGNQVLSGNYLVSRENLGLTGLVVGEGAGADGLANANRDLLRGLQLGYMLGEDSSYTGK